MRVAVTTRGQSWYLMHHILCIFHLFTRPVESPNHPVTPKTEPSPSEPVPGRGISSATSEPPCILWTGTSWGGGADFTGISHNLRRT